MFVYICHRLLDYGHTNSVYKKGREQRKEDPYKTMCQGDTRMHTHTHTRKIRDAPMAWFYEQLDVNDVIIFYVSSSPIQDEMLLLLTTITILANPHTDDVIPPTTLISSDFLNRTTDLVFL